MPALQEIFATCWFCIIIIFISLVNPPYEEAYSELSQTSRIELSAYIDIGMRSFLWEAAPKMFECILNMPLILLKLLSLSTICEGVYSNPSQAFGMGVPVRIICLTL